MANAVISLGDPEKMRRTIIRRAVKAAKREAIEDIKKTLNARIDKMLREEMDGIVTTTLESMAKTVLDAVVCRTDSYGTPKGTAKPFREHLLDEARDILAKPCDSDGRPKRDGYGYGGETSFLIWSAKKAAENWTKTHFHAEVQKAVEASKAEIVAMVVKAAADASARAAGLPVAR